MIISSAFKRDFLTYGIGYILALLLTGLAFAIVNFNLMAPLAAFAMILSLAFLQVLVHLRCFLHMTPDRSAREDLHLILFSVMVICLMLGGTLVIIYNLQARMM